MSAPPGALLAIAVACCGVACAGPASDNASVLSIKRLLLDEYVPTMDAGDIDGLRRFYSDDLTWLPPNEPAIRGVEACLDYIRPIFEQFNTRATLSIEEIKVADRLAFVWVDYVNQFTPKAEGEPMRDSGKLVYILEGRSNGRWKISRVIWNHNSSVP